MLKKIMLLAAALAALVAFAAPGVARAELTNGSGEAAENIEMTSENFTWTAGTTYLACETVRLSLALTPETTAHYQTTNSTNFIAQGQGGDHNNPECRWLISGPLWRFTEIDATVNFEGNGHGAADLAFSYDVTTVPPLSCSWESSEPATVTYAPTSDSFRVEGTLQGGKCPFFGPIPFHGDFTVKDEAGEPVSIH